jgi:hypothetical protein
VDRNRWSSNTTRGVLLSGQSMHVSNDKCQGIELSNLTKTTDDSDHLEHSTEPTSVSRDPFDEANEYEDWSGNLSKRNFSLDYSVVARAFAQRPRNLRPALEERGVRTTPNIFEEYGADSR